MIIELPDGREFRFSDDISEERARALVRQMLADETKAVDEASTRRMLDEALAANAALREHAEELATQAGAHSRAVTELTAKSSAEADTLRKQIADLTEQVDALKNARPTIVAKGAPPVDMTPVIAALMTMETSITGKLDAMIRAQLADTVLVRDEFGENTRSKKVIRNG